MIETLATIVGTLAWAVVGLGLAYVFVYAPLYAAWHVWRGDVEIERRRYGRRTEYRTYVDGEIDHFFQMGHWLGMAYLLIAFLASAFFVLASMAHVATGVTLMAVPL